MQICKNSMLEKKMKNEDKGEKSLKDNFEY